MSKPTLVAIAVLLVVTTTAAGTLATNDTAPVNDATSSNEAPLADAGLDQDVRRGATVLLDATGSRDPDGRIERYEWSIRTPAGDEITPDCADCARTRFTPAETGRYRVTITITDDDGATRSDTLYVDVSPGAAPTVYVSGPTSPTKGSSVTYTANVSAGAAALDYVVWRVSGNRIANHSLSAGQTTDTVSKYFPTAGNRNVTATVYDADGLAETGSLAVAVRSESESSPGPPSDSPTSGAKTADRNSPQITGDQLLTGARPFRGRYNVRLDAPSGAVASVEWRDGAGRIGRGHSLTRTWEPGDHELYAVVTYDDGSTNVATFADGTTTVTVDAEPNVSFESLGRYSSISGTVKGLDEYGNLNGLRVEVDGEVVAVAGATLRGNRLPEFGRQRKLRFSHDDFTPGEKHTVTVVASDERGQTVRASREIVPVEKPEIVRSEFVNGPVDSYHERIDPDRYTAHHVLEIDLNGVDPEKVDVMLQPSDDKLSKLGTEKYSEETSYSMGEILIHSYWAGAIPNTYYINAKMSIRGFRENSSGSVTRYSKFQVTPSKPELRLNVVNDGTENYITRDHGILVNASGSFDPDHTDLKYIWKYGAEPTKPDNTTAKFRSYERAASIVEDEYDLKSKRNFDFLNYFVPDVSNTTVLTEKPYSDEETVRVRIATEPYHFSKQTYYEDFSLGISVSNPAADVIEWKTVEAEQSGHSDATEIPYRYVGIVEIPTEALASTSSSQTVTVYNEENTRKKVEMSLPEIAVSGDKKYWTDVTVQDLSYLVEKPRTRKVTVDTAERRNEYLKQGYQIERKSEEANYVLEERVKTRDAKYETETQEFDSQRLRAMFLQSSNEWYASGRYQTRETRTENASRWYPVSGTPFEKKWHDSSPWNGERTGNIREVKVEPAEYRTQRKYRYENEIEKTKTMTVWRTGTRWVTKTGTRTVERCSLKFGCYDVTERYTYRTTETYTYRTTKTYTYTITETERYWATSKYDPDHTFTGKTRRTKISDAVYETRFEVKYKSQTTETVTHYEAAREKKVHGAVYEWRGRTSTTDLMLARKQVSGRDDWRMIEDRTTTWVLVQQDGTTTLWTPIYETKSNVVKTKAVVDGTVVTQSYDSETGKFTEKRKSASDEFVFEGMKSKNNIEEIITNGEGTIDWCRVKVACSSSNGSN
ncbi:PKD domain-containing protein [Halorussus gelatinilyticus]|uniref:PKD domain-containing protein n=1 Tax=Halorussus gelatinilyticus TaxID=2937524 RepID=A0A8U0IEY3_9EURY|nr:PKD domain-containing protein [Halorussus gelatinilyticus]UPV99532.1 PKD domain-containing protein [Halorussus gelatinilyticus]